MEESSSIKINAKEVTPEVFAQQCPVCNGFGTLKHGIKTCQGCEGKGYVFVPIRMDGRSRDGKPSKMV